MNRVTPKSAVGFLTALLLMAGAARATAAAPSAAMSDPRYEHVLGSPKAKVTVIEYASVGCPHCAVWAQTVFPQFKARFIDTGKVRFVFREMITGDSELAVAGFLVANCAPADRFFPFVDAVFADQAGVAEGGGTALYKVAKEQTGMSVDAFSACLTNDRELKDLETNTNALAEANGIQATPTFVINGRKVEGDQSLESLAEEITRARH